MLRRGNTEHKQTLSDKLRVTKIKNSAERLETQVEDVAQNIKQKNKEMENLREKMRHREPGRGTIPTNRVPEERK